MTPLQKRRIEQAAYNNALWCDAICRAHGGKTEMTESVWFNRQKSPPFYPNVDTLSRDGISAQMEVIQTLADTLPGEWGVKDSFCTLDLASFGFHLLFEASWIWRPVQPQLAQVKGDWKRVQSPNELARWEAAWRGQPANETAERIFLPSLLADERSIFLAAYEDQKIVAGGVVSHTGEVVGLSNVFTPVGEGGSYWASFVASAAHLFPDRPLVGYEQGDELAIARSLGFEALEPLRVWLHQP